MDDSNVGDSDSSCDKCQCKIWPWLKLTNLHPFTLSFCAKVIKKLKEKFLFEGEKMISRVFG